MINAITLSSCLLLLRVYLVSCYRQIHFTNADACDPDGTVKTLHIGEGALVLHLNNDSFNGMDTRIEKLHGDKKICNLLVKPKKGLGLLVYAEELDLRRQEGGAEGRKEACLDYVEFGQEDVIPFITLKRSGRQCGDQSGTFHYDDPGGQLLVWLKLGPAPAPGTLASRLTLVITPYKTKQNPYTHGGILLKKCLKGDYWIRKSYFCDGRVNCPLDPVPLDEAAASCATTPAPTAPPATSPRPGWERAPGSGDHGDTSLVSIVLISVVGLLVIACGIVCTLKKCRLGPLPRTPTSDHCPDTSLGMLALAAAGSAAQENTYSQPPEPSTHSPCPRPAHFSYELGGGAGAGLGAGLGGHTTSIRMPKQSPPLSRGEAEAPPPSYSDIFPPDYVPDATIMRGGGSAPAAQQGEEATSV